MSIFEHIRVLRTKYPAPIIIQNNGTATRKEKEITDDAETNKNKKTDKDKERLK